jgi:hypothetical protein
VGSISECVVIRKRLKIRTISRHDTEAATTVAAFFTHGR